MAGLTEIGGIVGAGLVEAGGISGAGLVAPASLNPPVNTVVPAISGTVTVGQTLTSSSGTWTGMATITFTYQWKRAGVAIGGATNNTYALVAGDAGAVITCTVTGTNGDGNASATSAGTSAVLYPPSNTVAPVVSGVETEGETLTTTNGTWVGAAVINYTYQWKRSGVNISSATNSTYLLVADDVGETILCAVTGTNGDGNATANSNETGEIQPAAGNLPTHAASFAAASNQMLSMADADFGAFDRAKFALSLWVKRASTGGIKSLYAVGISAGDSAFGLHFATDTLRVVAYSDGTNVSGELVTTATYTSTAAYYHILVHYDSANATAGDRMRLWVDGAEVTSFTTDTNPSEAVFNITGSVRIGRYASTAQDYDGLIYQLAFFSGALPAIGDVYDAGSPKDVTGISGLHSYVDCAGGDVTTDGVLAAAWTNTGTVTASTDIPT